MDIVGSPFAAGISISFAETLWGVRGCFTNESDWLPKEQTQWTHQEVFGLCNIELKLNALHKVTTVMRYNGTIYSDKSI